MRRTLAVLVVLAALAGCNGKPASDAGPAAGPTPTLGPDDLNVTGSFGNQSAVVGPVPGSGLPETRVLLDALRLNYTDALHRVRIHAVGDAVFEVDWRVQSPDQSPDAECLAGAVHAWRPPGLNGTPDLILGGYAVLWTTDSGVFAEAGAGGQEATLVADQFESTGVLFTEGRFEASGDLPAGGWIDVELGGSATDYLRDGSGTSNLTVDLRGAVRVEELPRAPLRCGGGTRELDSAQAAYTGYLANAAVDGRIGFATANASTAIVLDTSFEPSELRMQFLGAEAEPVEGQYNRTSGSPGAMELQFVQYASIQGQPLWYFADVQWPLLRS